MNVGFVYASANRYIVMLFGEMPWSATGGLAPPPLRCFYGLTLFEAAYTTLYAMTFPIASIEKCTIQVCDGPSSQNDLPDCRRGPQSVKQPNSGRPDSAKFVVIAATCSCGVRWSSLPFGYLATKKQGTVSGCGSCAGTRSCESCTTAA
jgi:hypothetical protein